MRISDWSSDVCSSDLHRQPPAHALVSLHPGPGAGGFPVARMDIVIEDLEIAFRVGVVDRRPRQRQVGGEKRAAVQQADYRNRKNADHANHRESHSTLCASHQLTGRPFVRSEAHTSELQSLIRNSYAVFSSKK